MTPKAHSELCKAAAAHDMQLRGWLETMAAAKGAFFLDEQGQYDPEEAVRLLRFIVLEACSFIADMTEMCDLEPSFAKDPRANSTLRKIYELSTNLFRFLDKEGLLRLVRKK